MPAKKETTPSGVEPVTAEAPKPSPIKVNEELAVRVAQLESQLKTLQTDFTRLVKSHGFVF